MQKSSKPVVDAADPSLVGQFDYTRAQAGRDKELLDAAPSGTGSEWVEGEHYDA